MNCERDDLSRSLFILPRLPLFYVSGAIGELHESICTPMDFDGQVFTDDDPSGEYPVPRDDIMVKNSLIPRCLRRGSSFLEIGTNDLVSLNEENAAELTAEVLENYREILRITLDHDGDIQIYIISIMPVLGNELRNQAARDINVELLAISKQSDRIQFIDCFDTFYDFENNTANTDYQLGFGTTHLNNLGYYVWAKMLLDYLMPLVPVSS